MPSPERIKWMRLRHHLTVDECSKMIYRSKIMWYRYEYGEIEMAQGLWELFCYKLFYPTRLLNKKIDAYYEKKESSGYKSVE